MSRRIKFGIVGGYGATGKAVVSELSKSGDGEILLGGRDVIRLEAAAAKRDGDQTEIPPKQMRAS